MISVFPTSRQLFFLSPFRTVLSAIHVKVTDRPSPDVLSLTQAITVQMVYSEMCVDSCDGPELKKSCCWWPYCTACGMQGHGERSETAHHSLLIFYSNYAKPGGQTSRETGTQKWRLGTDEDASVLWLNVQANFPEQRRAAAGPLTGYIAIRSLLDGSISCLLRKRATANPFTRGFLLFLEQQGEHDYYSLTKNQERTTLPSTTSDRQRARVKHKNVCKSKAWRDGANLKAHIASRAFPREKPVRGRFFFRTPFSTTFRWRIFSQTNGNRLVGAPRAHFRQKLKLDK